MASTIVFLQLDVRESAIAVIGIDDVAVPVNNNPVSSASPTPVKSLPLVLSLAALILARITPLPLDALVFLAQMTAFVESFLNG